MGCLWICTSLLGVAAVTAHAEPAWRSAVDDTIAAACAVRGLAARKPLDVRPMAEFEGGYTSGIGSVVWQEDHAEQWRAGWCALGVYCVTKRPAADAGTNNRSSPAGLFDTERNVLFVRDIASADAKNTVAHETTHALQYQNFPWLRNVHLWYNRDLAAAAAAAIEGDAHVVGSFFDAERQLYLCSMNPDHATANRIRSHGWQPHSLWAYEGFGHVFGPEPALKRWLAGGASMDDWLRDPPLATLAVLRPEQTPEVDFIDLADDLASDELTGRGCVAGLANTAGALGIWGLLVQHGAATAEQLPAFLEHWRGDRFLHIACAGAAADELAWVSRWRSAEAADEFATRYRAIAASIQAHGETLGAVPTPFVRDATVVVVTPGLHETVARLAAAPVRTFSRFSDWLASGCFPQDECYASDAAVPTAAGSRHLCRKKMARPARFGKWLARIRAARAVATVPQAELDIAMAAATELAKFCAVNRADNADWMQACRATYYGVHYQAQLLRDTNWQLLPYCATAAGMRDWYRTTYYAEAEHADEVPFFRLYGPAFAGRALAEHGIEALTALAAEPPLSTLAIMQPDSNPTVDFMRLPRAELAALGCEIAASSVQGILSVWGQLVDAGTLAEEPTPPAFFSDWRGDRRAYLRCGEDEGWIWISRWASENSARAFAALAAKPANLSTVQSAADAHTVWISPPTLATAKTALQEGLEVRSYSTFAAWRGEGCFPQTSCN